ncbi:MAG: RidA family protein [Saprospiraceae bacterium]|nr:RidA family protein [Saprospiraceae bacterium]
MGKVEARLEELGYKLEPAKPAVANYLGSKRAGNLLFVSGRKSELTGEVDTEVTIEEAKEAARDTVLLILAIVKNDIKDLDFIEGVVKLQGFIRSSREFIKQPQVLDGASELLIDLFGMDGHHARTATGAPQLPYGATIQLDMVLKLRSD